MRVNQIVALIFALMFIVTFPLASQLSPSNFLSSEFRDNFGYGDPSSSNYTIGSYKISEGIDLSEVEVVGDKIVGIGKLLNDTNFEKQFYIFLFSLDWGIETSIAFDDLAVPEFLGSLDNMLVLLGRQKEAPFTQEIAVYEISPFRRVWGLSFTELKGNYGVETSKVFPVVFGNSLALVLATAADDNATISLVLYDSEGTPQGQEDYSVSGSVEGVSVEGEKIFIKIDEPFYGNLFYVQNLVEYGNDGFSQREFKVQLPSGNISSISKEFFPISIEENIGLEIKLLSGQSPFFAYYSIIKGNGTLASFETNLTAMPVVTDNPFSFRYAYSHTNENWFIPLSPFLVYKETQLIGFSSPSGFHWDMETLTFNTTSFGSEFQFLGIDYIETEETGYYVFQANEQKFGALIPFGSGALFIDLNRDYPSQLRKVQLLDLTSLMLLRSILILIAVSFWLNFRFPKRKVSNISTFPNELDS